MKRDPTKTRKCSRAVERLGPVNAYRRPITTKGMMFSRSFWWHLWFKMSNITKNTIRSPNWLNEDRRELCYYLRTRSTSGLVWSIFFLSSGSFLTIAVSSQFENDCMMNRNALNIGPIQRSNNIKPWHLENGSTDKNNWHAYIFALFNSQVNFNITHNESVSNHLTLYIYIWNRHF